MNSITNRGGTGKIFTETDRNQINGKTIFKKPSASLEEIFEKQDFSTSF